MLEGITPILFSQNLRASQDPGESWALSPDGSSTHADRDPE